MRRSMLTGVSERELRDEIEQLSAELRDAREELEFTRSVSGEHLRRSPPN